jgi:hypothetical protein
MDSDYKKYSLEQLDNWMHDAMSSGGASPQEIYDVIKGVVEENYYTYKYQASQAYELLALLNGNGKGHIEEYDEYKGSTVSSVSDTMPPWGHSDMEALKYTDEELNAMCDKAASDQEKEKCREYNLREAEYYDKRAKLDAEHSKHYYDYTRNDSNRKNPFLTYDEAIAAGYEMTDDGFWISSDKKGKVKKWILPVEEVKDTDTDETEYFVSFPDNLLEAAKLKEGDEIKWVDNGDGSYTITKVTKPLEMDEC